MNSSFINNCNWNTQKYLISSKTLSHSLQIIKVFNKSKIILKDLNPYLSLYHQTHMKKKRTNLNSLKFYNIVNVNFYDMYTQWYNKRLTIIGRHISEFSLDLKPFNTLTPKQVVTNENIKLEFKSRHKRKKPFLVYNLSRSVDKHFNTNAAKHFKQLKQTKYRLLTPFKKKKKGRIYPYYVVK